ncbi:TMEM165/GDT1 family protein [Cyberlindnera jadinii NRRL Y-1542]|uniref:GDT1 family protein n=2 Tax=Cyberlindnera jadinii (strain ATCC 18201 / CBS 1600 / BCRC 20928 / JCM 3617 / NBRC 0987 / NRRL Y-1542) TaxID=983966 RepID=A0A1E4S4I8_CYBJN|nr:UPF0016-domain-containing protein [Cyberlindnera jadinii NRRL Y-1542]ODV74411.1 UPF0016-domain-containing protein [Cyberlindnera jadinii NRRL Y-1542]
MPPIDGGAHSPAINTKSRTVVKAQLLDGFPERSKKLKAAMHEVQEQRSASVNPFILSISMILVSEIGDKTFLISALMAMRHSRVVIFTASIASLAVMTVLSGILGHTLPTILSKRVTQFVASFLFLVFGYTLTKDGLAMSKNLGVEEELAEVKEELSVIDLNRKMSELENGPVTQPAPKTNLGWVQVFSSSIFSPLWVQTFVMVFLAEWGDRSQVSTIAMAAGSDYGLVILGGTVGHAICSSIAVLGGHFLASRLSMRTVTLSGAFAFYIFSVVYFYNAWYDFE